MIFGTGQHFVPTNLSSAHANTSHANASHANTSHANTGCNTLSLFGIC